MQAMCGLILLSSSALLVADASWAIGLSSGFSLALGTYQISSATHARQMAFSSYLDIGASLQLK
jgi:hypothetical protein